MCHYSHTRGRKWNRTVTRVWYVECNFLLENHTYSEEDISYCQTKQCNDYNYEVYWGLEI